MKLPIVFQSWLSMTALTSFAVAVEGSSEASKRLRNNPDHQEKHLSTFDATVEQENNDLASSRALFSGEDFIRGPWHHDVFSRIACKNHGLPDEVAAEIAWHADYTDSYAYNPLWWFNTPRFIHRFKSAKSLAPDLVKVHYDDLFTIEQVVTAYYRYTKGCLVGLKWAAEIFDGAWDENDDDFDPIGAAHNILGVAFHATQDFYSHSNWIDDPNRRNKIFWDLGRCTVKDLYLYTGNYEEKFGIKEHGVFLFSDSDICREYKDCGKPVSVSGGQVLGVKIPDNALYFAPPGINLDNTWQAEIGVKVREIVDISGAKAFNISGDLAIKASSQLLAIAEKFMNSQGHSGFWSAVKSKVSSKPKENEFEYFNHFPLQFLSAGPYPVGLNDEGVYLRITLKTSTDTFSGTDATMKVIGQGKQFSMDYMPGAFPLVGYNDFENGDETVYTVGPFDTLPSSIQIKNDAPDYKDILVAIAEDIKNFFERLWSSIRDLFLNQADYVGSGSFVMQPTYFDSLILGIASEHKIYIDGGAEGRYDIYVQVKKLSESTTGYTFEVTILRLHCLEESNVDGFTTKDEPFVLAVLSSYPGTRQSKLIGPFKDVDSGDTSVINQTFSQITFAKPRGAMTLAFQIWEHDKESLGERVDALNKMEGDTGSSSSPNTEFFIRVGEAIAADWKLDSIRVYAFSRGESLRAGLVLFDDTDQWIKSGETSRSFNLNPSRFKSLGKLNNDPRAICKHVFKETGEFCGANAEAKEFNGNSTDPECDALSFSAQPMGPYALGDTAVLLTVTDSVGNTNQCNTIVTVVDKAPTISGCPKPIAPAPAKAPCFSSFNTVDVKDVGDIPMNKLKIGEFVKTTNGKFTQVYGFGHYDHEMQQEFIHIILDDDNSNNYHIPFEVSSEHLVFVERNNQLYSIPASEIIIGDHLGDDGKKVKAISTVSRRGVYAPLTESGDLFVNGGILASNYVNILHSSIFIMDQHRLGHALVFPQRLLCSYYIDICKKETYINGYGFLVYIIIQIGSFINMSGWFGNIIVSILSIPLVGIVSILESITILRLICLVATATLVVGRILMKTSKL